MEQPTETQIKEFWEWCGFCTSYYGHGRAWFINNEILFYVLKDDEEDVDGLPPIDLNNLFKYAVPKVYATELVKINRFEQEFQPAYQAKARMASKPWTQKIRDKDPALALFWAIWEVNGKHKNS